MLSIAQCKPPRVLVFALFDLFDLFEVGKYGPGLPSTPPINNSVKMVPRVRRRGFRRNVIGANNNERCATRRDAAGKHLVARGLTSRTSLTSLNKRFHFAVVVQS